MLKRHEHHNRTGRLFWTLTHQNTRQLGCVFQDVEPPKSSSISRKSSNTRKPIRCVNFTKAVVRHADIRDQNPLVGMTPWDATGSGGLGRQFVGGRLVNHAGGTTSTSHGMATVESGWSHICQPAVSQSIAQERQSKGQPQVEKPVKCHAVEGEGQDCQVRGSIDRDWRRSGSCGSARGIVEGCNPGPSSARSHDPAEASLTVEDEVGDQKTRFDGRWHPVRRRDPRCATSSVASVPLTSAHNRSHRGQ